MDFTFPCELSIYFDLNPFFFLLGKDSAFFGVGILYNLDRPVLPYSELVTFVQS